MNEKGFTLIELLVTLAVAMIVLSIGIPSFSETIKNNQLKTAANGYFGLVQFARSEAVRLGLDVRLSATNNNWSEGAVAWVDTNGDGALDTDVDQLIRVLNIEGNAQLTSSQGNSSIIFNGKGYANVSTTFSFCDSRDNETGKELSILASGFATVGDKDNCS